MIPSFIGIALCVVLYLIGRLTQDALIAALILSIPFGSTTIATISALGGASPPIYVAFIAIAILSIFRIKDLFRYQGILLRADYVASSLLVLMIYALAGSYVLPRLFAGEVTIFQVSRETGGVEQALLAPVSYNITQTVYFVAGAVSYFAIAIRLLKNSAFDAVKFGFFGAASINAGLAVLDLGGKLAGLGDVLSPLRTANYAMLTEDAIGGFFRIAAGFPEASAFAGTTLALFAFTATYWRTTGGFAAGILSFVQAALLLLSTSSTAYGGCAILLSFWLIAVAYLAITGKALSKRDLLLTAIGVVGLAMIVAILIYNDRLLLPAQQLFDSMVLNKASSASAIERGTWNASSLEALVTTGGLGIGIGSSRTSSWLVATLAHLGVPGAAMVAALVYFLLRGLRGVDASTLSAETVTTVNSVRVASLVSLAAGAIAAPSADPGVLFFLALAVVSTARIKAVHNLAGRPASPE